MILEIKEISHKSKRTTEIFIRKFIVIQCDNEECKKIREYGYKKKLFDKIVARGYVGCSKSCGTKLGLEHMPEENIKARDKKISEKSKLAWSDEEKHQQRIIGLKEAYQNKSEEEKLAFAERSRQIALETWKNSTTEEKEARINKMKFSLIEIWQNKSQEEKDEISKRVGEAVKEAWKNISNESRERHRQAIQKAIETNANKSQEEKLEIADKIRKTLQEYNENMPQDERIRINSKIIETQKNNEDWSSGVSKIELRLKKLLEDVFSKEDIEHWRHVNGSAIDFYIKSLDVYLQLDGIYWHGLDRPLEELAKSSKVRDKKRYEAYFKDRKQDKWFLDNNLQLSRITDIEAYNLDESNIIECIYKNIVKEVKNVNR